jgi:hypothetical protein
VSKGIINKKETLLPCWKVYFLLRETDPRFEGLEKPGSRFMVSEGCLLYRLARQNQQAVGLFAIPAMQRVDVHRLQGEPRIVNHNQDKTARGPQFRPQKAISGRSLGT